MVEHGTLAPRLPFVVAVSGHRDLHPDDAAMVGDRLYTMLRLVVAALPHTPLLCLSALADGADQLFALQALRLARTVPGRVQLRVPLPMPLDDYIRTQAGPGAAQQAAFAARLEPMLALAGGAFQIPPGPGRAAGQGDDAPYVRLADYLAQQARLLVAVWDGQAGPAAQFPRLSGGTLDTVLARLESQDGPLAQVYARRQADSSKGLPAAMTRSSAALAIGGWAVDGRPQVRPLRERGAGPRGRRWRRVLARAEAVVGRLDPQGRALLYQIWRSGRDLERLNRGFLRPHLIKKIPRRSRACGNPY